MIIGAAHSGEALMKVSAFRAFSDYIGNYRSKEGIFTREAVVVAILEVIKVMSEYLPQW